MRADPQTDLPWPRLTAWIAEKTGLHFPPERLPDLHRGLAGAAEEFGLADAAACAQWLLSTPLSRAQLHALAGHLTIGETYFFRDHSLFEALAERVLPELIFRRRRDGDRRLRLWSAACCTGEEPYSLAAVLHRLIPDPQDWRISILATDINERFLKKAVAGVYGEWSFRESTPDFLERCFTPTARGRYEIRPELKRWVSFAHLNLAEDTFPSLVTDTHAMDVIFCRNVLMYFTPAHARRVIENLHRSLVEGGWLAVSASETSQALFSRFTTVNFPGCLLYHKREGATHASAVPQTRTQSSEATPRDALIRELPAPWMSRPAPLSRPSPTAETPLQPDAAASRASPASEGKPDTYTQAAAFYEQGLYGEAADLLSASVFAQSGRVPVSSQRPGFSLLARALANQGKLDDALYWCDRWIAADKLNPNSHYLRAMVLQELGRSEPARRSLQQVLYLEPAFVLAHFALGTLARADATTGEANKHFDNALHLLRNRPVDEVLPESDGLTSGRLKEIITAFLALPPQRRTPA